MWFDGRNQKCNYNILAWEAYTLKANKGYTKKTTQISQLIIFIPPWMTVVILEYTVLDGPRKTKTICSHGSAQPRFEPCKIYSTVNVISILALAQMN